MYAKYIKSICYRKLINDHTFDYNSINLKIKTIFSDKFKLHFVELLAASASKSNIVGRPEDVDESYLCGCPGKIVDAELLYEILKSPADEHVFFGTGKYKENVTID